MNAKDLSILQDLRSRFGLVVSREQAKQYQKETGINGYRIAMRYCEKVGRASYSVSDDMLTSSVAIMPSQPVQRQQEKKSRGIQKGTTAYDEASKTLDQKVKQVAKMLLPILQAKYGPKLSWRPKLLKLEIHGGVGACMPDGGLWYWNNMPIAVFEAKKQGERGNAIDRAFKNYTHCRRVDPNINFVFFTAGEGAAENKVIWKTLHSEVTDGEFNKFHPNGTTCYMSVSGYTNEQIADYMTQAIEAGIHGATIHMGGRQE